MYEAMFEGKGPREATADATKRNNQPPRSPARSAVHNVVRNDVALGRVAGKFQPGLLKEQYGQRAWVAPEYPATTWPAQRAIRPTRLRLLLRETRNNLARPESNKANAAETV